MPRPRYAHTLPNRAVGWSGYKAGCKCPGCLAGCAEHKARQRANRKYREAGETSQGRRDTSLVSMQPVTSHAGTYAAGRGRQLAAEPQPVDYETHRRHCQQILSELMQKAQAEPGTYIRWTTDDDGLDITHLLELADEWFATHPNSPLDWGTNDAGQFCVWMPEESQPTSGQDGISDQLARERQQREEIERQRAAAQRQQELAAGSFSDWAL